MQTPAINPIAAAPTPLRSTRDVRNDGGFEDVLGALLEPARDADVNVSTRRESHPLKSSRHQQRPESPESADKADGPEAPVEVADSEPQESAAAVPAEVRPEPEASSPATPEADDSAATSATTDPAATGAPAEAADAATIPAGADAVSTDTATAPTIAPAAPVSIATDAEATDIGHGIEPNDANPTAGPIGDVAATAPDVAAEPEADPAPAGGEFVAPTARSGNAPAEPPGQRIAALAPELRGTDLASIAADKTLPKFEPRATAGREGSAMPAASTVAASNSSRPLVDAGALITAVADRPATNAAAGATAGTQIAAASPATTGAAVVPAMSGTESQFDPTGDQTGLHLGFAGTGTTTAASGPHATAGPSQQAFSLRTPVEQVALQVVRAAGQKIDHLQLTLEPADLGRVDIRLELGPDNRLALVVAADRPETLDLLQRDARVLERALQDAGLKTDPDSLSFNLRGDGRNDRDGTRTLAEASAAIEPDSIEAELPPAQAADAYRPAASGSLDIRI